jgi:hypothetical protein
MSDHVESVLEEVEPEQQRGNRPDAANQQMVRPDGSGPATVGNGGSTWPPEGGQQRKTGSAGLDEMTKDELLDYARSRDISPANGGMTKDELRASIDEAEA